MMRRKDGATLAEIMQATGWQAHTVRGFMAGTLKKMGLTVESFRRRQGANLPDGEVGYQANFRKSRRSP